MTQDATTAGLAIIADDEDTGRVLLVESVSEVGLRSLSFANGSDALAAALANDVSIVLLDVDMPGMNGYEVCRRLRAEAGFATIPIVMVTATRIPPPSPWRSRPARPTSFPSLSTGRCCRGGSNTCCCVGGMPSTATSRRPASSRSPRTAV